MRLLYHLPLSPFSRKVRLVLAEKRLPFELEVEKVWQRRPEYLELNPACKVPTLVDANGRTLYLFEADRPNVSILSAAGQAIWPPFTATTTPRALSGAVAGRIGTVTQAGGAAQVTYKGHPLYYYVGDHSPGQTSGGRNFWRARRGRSWRD